MVEAQNTVANWLFDTGRGAEQNNIRIHAQFTNQMGMETQKHWKRLQTFGTFMLHGAGGWKNYNDPDTPGPDWSDAGLCKYQKIITLGVQHFGPEGNLTEFEPIITWS